MRTPVAALTWELWRKNRARLIAIVGFLWGFAVLYPKLCALAGFSLDDPEGEVEYVDKAIQAGGLARAARFLNFMFLTQGPHLAMLLSLFCVTWMFTFIELDRKNKNAMTFPGRLFTLPVSTLFLFWWLFLSGLAAVGGLFECWIHFVRFPLLGGPGEYQKLFTWMTVVALTQGIVWALASWPATQLVALIGVLLCFLVSAAWRGLPFVLPPIFLLGMVMARIGLQKMRHGQWQGWDWQRLLAALSGQAPLRGPKCFVSPAQAQLWFERRLLARGLCFFAGALALAPLLIQLIIHFYVGPGIYLGNEKMSGVSEYLIAMPFFVHFWPQRLDRSFIMVRPLTNGQIVMAALKSAALSTVFAWLAALVALYAVHWSPDVLPRNRAVVVMVLAFLTWRIVAVELCFVLGDHRWGSVLPWLKFLAVLAVAMLFFEADNFTLRRYLPFIPCALECLVAVKFLAAWLAYRACMKRRLLSRTALVSYLAIWIVLVAALLLLVSMARPFFQGIDSSVLVLVVILAVPLARIGFCPIALEGSRHT